MAYCTNCGEPLSGAKRFCNRCGYENNVPEPAARDRGREEKGFERDAIGDFRVEDARVEVTSLRKDDAPSRPSGGPCAFCGEKGTAECHFCKKTLCGSCSVQMKIFLHRSPFGSPVASCRECSVLKDGKPPTKDEAERAAAFFQIKPYHEWRIVK